MKSSLSIVISWILSVVFYFKKASPYPRSSKLSPMLSSRSFIVPFDIQVMIHFEVCVQIQFFAGDAQLFQHCLLKRLVLLCWLALLLWQRSVEHIYVDLLLSSLFFSIDPSVYSINTILCCLLQLYSKYGSQCQSVQLCCSPLHCIGYYGSFTSPYKLQNQFVNISKK